MKLRLVDCTEEFWEFVRLLRTDPKNQNGFFSEASITPEEQKKFMTENSSNYRICLYDDKPSGYIGIINQLEITYCVHPDFQGKGIGKFMVNEFSKHQKYLIAYVKENNIASQKVFEKLGWEKQIFYKKKTK